MEKTKNKQPSLRKMLIWLTAPLIILGSWEAIERYKNSKSIHDERKIYREIQRNDRQFKEFYINSEKILCFRKAS